MEDDIQLKVKVINNLITLAIDPRELIESRRGSETSLRGSFYSTQETSLTNPFFTPLRLVSEG